MYKILLQLEWKQLLRSANSGRSIGIRILFIFIFLYFALILMAFSSGAYFIIKEQFPEANPLLKFNSFLIYYFGIEFMIRFILQKIPIVRLKPLLVQNIDKRQLIHFLLFKSTFSIFNTLPLFAFTPFAITLIVNGYEPKAEVYTWWISVLLISLFLNYFNLYIQKKIAKSSNGLILIIAVYGLIYALQYFNILNIPELIGKGIEVLTSNPLYIFVILVFIVLAYMADFYDYKKDLYIESDQGQRHFQVNKMEYFWIDYFGPYGPYIHNDIRLIWRNKRTKNTLFLAGFMLFYALVFIFNPTYSENENMKYLIYYFCGILMTGMFLMNFGQFIPSWDSEAYGLFSTANIGTREYLTSKVLLLSISVVIVAPLVFLYAIIDMDVIWPFVAGIFTNLGIILPALLLLSAYNYKKLDMSKSSMMNYQGLGWTQWLGVSLAILIPVGFYGIISIFTTPRTAFTVIQVFSIIGIIAIPWLIKKTTELYGKTKYKRIQGFKA